MTQSEVKHVKKIDRCRICGSSRLEDFFDMGNLPLPNAFLTKEDVQKPEKRFPLVVCFCHDCTFVQLRYIVEPDQMFKHYLYIPSGSQIRIQNFNEIAFTAHRRFHLQSDSLVIDIGSNDGSLLSCFQTLGVQVLGVDPAENLKVAAELKGIPTLSEYFTQELAQDIVNTYKKAALVTTTNVFAHIEHLLDSMRAIYAILDEDGVFISQFPYLLDLLRDQLFDTIYHEHMSYYSLNPLLLLAERTGFKIFDIQHVPLDGGSIRVFWKKKESHKWKIEQETIDQFRAIEEREKLYTIDTYKDFGARVQRTKEELLQLLGELKQDGKRIVGYGAPAKGTILLNYFHIDKRLLDYVVDSTVYKQGLYFPGVHLEIFPESKIYEDRPEYLLILAWNFATEIIEKNKRYQAIGKFILPSPEIATV